MPIVHAPAGHGNDHHFSNGIRQPDLNYAYEPHGPTAGADEAEKAALEARELADRVQGQAVELAAAQIRIAELEAELAAKAKAAPKGKADG